VRARFRTNYWLWAFAATCLFVVLGFVDHLAGTTYKGDHSLWSYVGIAIHGEYHSSTAEFLAAITFHTILRALPAALVGWVAQALAVVVFTGITQRTATKSGRVHEAERNT
jgi:hypothetical protein